MIDCIEFTAQHLTYNAGLLLLLENTRKNGVFDWIDQELMFGNRSTEQAKMNHIQTLLCGNFIGIDKLECLKQLQGDPLVREYAIAVKEPETISRFLGNFSYKTTQMMHEVNIKVFCKLLQTRKLMAITIDIDSSVVNMKVTRKEPPRGTTQKSWAISVSPCNSLSAMNSKPFSADISAARTRTQSMARQG